jgi:hypothetical protein
LGGSGEPLVLTIRWSCDVREFTSLPGFYLLAHRLEISLHSIHSHRTRALRG